MRDTTKQRRRSLAVVGAAIGVAFIGAGGVLATSGNNATPDPVEADSLAPRAVDAARATASGVVGGLRFTLAPPLITDQGTTGDDRLCLQASLPEGFSSIGCGQREVVLRDGVLVRFTSDDHAVLAGYAPRGASNVTVGASSSAVTREGFFVVAIPDGGDRAIFRGATGTNVVPLAQSKIVAPTP